MSFFYPQNPGIGGLDELTPAEEVFLTSLAGLSFQNGDILYYNNNLLNTLHPTTNGYVLTLSAGLPVWSASTSGVTTFLALTDTPSSYAGQAGKGVRVNAGESAIEFFTLGGGGGTPAGSNGELQYNNGGAFGGMAGITYENVNGALILDNTLSANALFQTSAGAGVRKGLVVQIGASSDSNGADISLYAGEGFTKGGDVLIESGNTQNGEAGILFLRAGLSTTGDDGLVKVQSDNSIYLTDISQTKGLYIDTLNTDKIYVFPTVDGVDGDLMATDGVGNMYYQDSRAFFQYLGSLRGYDTVFTYDGSGNVSSKIFGDISVTLTYTYDIDGNLEMIESSAPTYTKTFTYDVDGNVTNINYT